MLGVPMCVVSHLLSHANATNTSLRQKQKRKGISNGDPKSKSPNLQSHLEMLETMKSTLI